MPAPEPWHFLYLRPLPQGQGSLRPTLRPDGRPSGRAGPLPPVRLVGAGAAAPPPRLGARRCLLGGAALLHLAARRGGRGRLLRQQRDVEDAPHDVLADVV